VKRFIRFSGHDRAIDTWRITQVVRSKNETRIDYTNGEAGGICSLYVDAPLDEVVALLNNEPGGSANEAAGISPGDSVSTTEPSTNG
jgi:hypothetical protein